MDYLKLSGLVVGVTLLVTVSITIDAWGVTPFETSSITAKKIPCSDLDMWAPRVADRQAFAECIASAVGLKGYDQDKLSVGYQRHYKYGETLVLSHVVGDSGPCHKIINVWYLDRKSREVVDKDSFSVVC